MALERSDEPVIRARDAARRSQADWPGVRAAALQRIRLLTAPGEPVAMVAAGGGLDHDAAGSRGYVSTRVLRSVLRRVLTVTSSHAPVAMDLIVDDGRIVRLDVSLVVAFGAPLPPLGTRVRADVVTAVEGLLGPGSIDPMLVGVTVVDVVPGDPTTV